MRRSRIEASSSRTGKQGYGEFERNILPDSATINAVSFSVITEKNPRLEDVRVPIPYSPISWRFESPPARRNLLINRSIVHGFVYRNFEVSSSSRSVNRFANFFRYIEL